ncbi:MAG: SMI1/KNR4 family protein [Myxococcota bacterium]|jgi:hypothetical protein|nr:SMI1/KNR4 family protein [Myxococcota bacterium]
MTNSNNYGKQAKRPIDKKSKPDSLRRQPEGCVPGMARNNLGKQVKCPIDKNPQSTVDASSPSPWASELLAKLALLRKLKAEGAATRFAKPLSPHKLEAFENQYQLRLPEDYRDFLLYVGNGGGGPDYGIAPLQAWAIDALPRLEVRVQGERNLAEGASELLSTVATPERAPLRCAASLLRPFPLERAWSVEEEPPPFSPGSTPYDGCLELSDLGCGYFTFLVVNGARRGEVWIDYSAAMDDAKLEPIAASFRDWFERQWLDGWLVSSLCKQIQSTLSRALPQQAQKKARAKGAAAKSRGNRSSAQSTATIRSAKCRYHDQILRWQDCFVLQPERPYSFIHRAWLELYLASTADGDTEANYSAFDTLCEKAPSAGVDEQLLAPLLRLRYAEAFSQAEDNKPEALQHAAKHPCALVRRAVAANRAAPAALLSVLASDARDDVRRAVALNSSAPEQVLMEVVDGVIQDWEREQTETLLLILDTAARRSSNTAGERAKSSHSNSAMRTISRLEEGPLGPWAVRAALLSRSMEANEYKAFVSHPSPVIRHAVALAGPLELLASLATDADDTVREAVASRTELPLSVLEALAHDQREQVQRALAAHPKAPPTLLTHFCVQLRQHYSVTYALATRPLPHALEALHLLHPNYSPSQNRFGLWPYTGRRGMRALPLDASFAEVCDLGIYSHPSYPEPLLAPHIPEQYNIGGYEMGLHPWLSAELMELLSRNEYAYCRGRIAERADVSEELLLRLAADEVPLCRGAAAQNVRLPVEVWEQLGNDHEDVRCGAASNLVAPVEGLTRLAADPNPWVRRALLQNPRTPQPVIEVLSASPEPDVRKWAPLATALSSETLARLLKDEHEAVRKAARWRQLRERLLAA